MSEEHGRRTRQSLDTGLRVPAARQQPPGGTGVPGARHPLPASQRLAARSVEDLWHEYVAQQRSEPARNALVIHYLPLVRQVADRMRAGLPLRVDVRDLYAEGHIGLIEAVERFQASRDVKFETFAQWRIKGAIRDYLRRQDWLSRSLRDQLKAVERAVVVLEHRLGRTPLDSEIATHLNAENVDPPWSSARVRETLTHYATSHIGSLQDLSPHQASHSAPIGEAANGAPSPADEASNLLQFSEVRTAVADLAERERELIALYFYEELTMAEIGRILRITESRVSQILKKLLISLSARIAEQEAS